VPRSLPATRRLLLVLLVPFVFGLGGSAQPAALAGTSVARAAPAAPGRTVGNPSRPPSAPTSRVDQLGVNLGLGTQDQFRAQALLQTGSGGIGVGWVRAGCDWGSVEPAPGQWNWATCDSLLSDINAAGLKPLLKFEYSVDWCTTADQPGLSVTEISYYPPCNYGTFQDFIFHLVSRYGPNSNGLTDGDPNYGQNLVHYWEVGNEPDVKGEFRLPASIPESSAASTYAQLQYYAYNAIKSADPAAQVLFAGLALNLGSTSSNYRPTFFLDVLQDPTYPAARYFDIASYHCYDPKFTCLDKMTTMKTDLATVGATKPIWVTEVGYPSDSTRQVLSPTYYPYGEPGQAAYLQDMIAYLLSPDIGAGKVFWFDAEDVATDPSVKFCTDGLLYVPGYQCDQAGPAPSSSVLVQKQSFGTFKAFILLVDTSFPTVSLTSPSNGATVPRLVILSATAADNNDVLKVEFYVDGTLLQTDWYPPYQAGWDTSGLAGGSTHTLVVKAYDLVWNVTSSTPVTVTVAGTSLPTVSLVSPTDGAMVSGTVPLLATASDSGGISKVEFYVDGGLIATDPVAPYTASWNTGGYKQGAAHTLYAQAYDTSGHSSKSSPVSVTLADTMAPATAITAPLNGALVSGLVPIQATATDNVGVTRVQFYVDGTLLATDTVPPYTGGWNAGGLGLGTSHTLITKAYDAAGNVGTSAAVTVRIGTPKAATQTSAAGAKGTAAPRRP